MKWIHKQSAGQFRVIFIVYRYHHHTFFVSQSDFVVQFFRINVLCCISLRKSIHIEFTDFFSELIMGVLKNS